LGGSWAGSWAGVGQGLYILSPALFFFVGFWWLISFSFSLNVWMGTRPSPSARTTCFSGGIKFALENNQKKQVFF
jgi:hypothetical protein